MITEISNAAESLQIVDRRCNALWDLVDVPQTDDIKQLQTLIQSLQQAQHKIEQTNKSIRRLNEKLESLVQELEKWAVSNPTCPTCGAATDVQQLLQKKMGSGCHE